MHLKSMEVFGFKSFADKTKIQFEPGITAIVGPNGCGKSNVVDSIKWVLGEKKAKNIRGNKMEDVIFTGTEHRKPVSMAEVSVVFSNENHELKIDADEVTITRRVFRDGESEYLINKSPVRLKDIEILLMDTGIGKSSYSVMEQGKIDMILSTKAEDRRYIFEEAAGVSRFKMQKKDSMKKLQDTGENLERITDIISEIDREKDLKAKQAEKTKKYLVLRDDLKKNDLKLQILKYRDINRKKVKVETSVNKLKEERSALAEKMSNSDSENEKDERRKNELQLKLFDFEKKLHTYRIKVEDIDGRTVSNKKLIEEQQERQLKIKSNVAERTQSLQKLQAEKLKTEDNGVAINRRLEDDKAKLTEFFNSRKQKLQLINDSRDLIEKNKLTIQEKNENLKILRERLEVVVKRLIDAIEEQKNQMVADEPARMQLQNEINNQLKELEQIIDDARTDIGMGMSEEASKILGQLDILKLSTNVKEFQSFDDGLRSLLLDKSGIHSQKEKLDTEIKIGVEIVESLRNENNELDLQIREYQRELEEINTQITKVEKDLSRDENEKIWLEKHLKTLSNQIADINSQIKSLAEDQKRIIYKITKLNEEIASWSEKLVEFNDRSVLLRKKVALLNQKMKELDQKIIKRKDYSQQEAAKLQKLADKISQQEHTLVEHSLKLTNVEEYIWTEYEKKLEDIKKVKVDELELVGIQEKIAKLKQDIQSLGLINNLAIEEYKNLKKRSDYYQQQKKDIETARNDIVGVIEDINKTSVEMFIKTFNQIQKNFSMVFKQLFEGGDATLVLVDEENVLESGIEILVRPPGKKPKSITLLSGGERSLTAIALLFATYMVKPSPFCFLDEIDAPLDEGNVGRFLNMLKQFSQKTQFMVVTHNKKTMSVGQSIYGVTMEEPGISKIVSLKLERSEPITA